MDAETSMSMKRKLHRIVAMLTRMAMQFGGVSEVQGVYLDDGDYEQEHHPPQAD